jgi:hypothetical protein
MIAMLLVASTAEAVGTSATVSWTLATSYIDGTPLLTTDIKETQILWRRPGASGLEGSVRVAAPTVTRTITSLVCGKYEFYAVTVLNKLDAAGKNIVSAATAVVPYDTGIACVTPQTPASLAVS